MTLLPARNAIVVFLSFAFAYFFSALLRAVTATLAPTLTQEFALNARDPQVKRLAKATLDWLYAAAAVKYRGGEQLGTFRTLVNPGQSIPPAITVLTGITESMVHRAPRIETVLPSFLECARDSVVVGHNVRFDLAFPLAELSEGGQGPLPAAADLRRRHVGDQPAGHRR